MSDKNKKDFTEFQKTQINEGLNRTFPKTPWLLQNYETPIYDLLANPLKMSIAYIVIIIIIAFILRQINLLKFVIRLDKLKLQILILIVLMFFIAIHQLKINKNISYVLKSLPNDTTFYDYKELEIRHDSMWTMFTSMLIGDILARYISFNINKPASYYLGLGL
jgi:hypothetical protein